MMDESKASIELFWVFCDPPCPAIRPRGFFNAGNPEPIELACGLATKRAASGLCLQVFTQEHRASTGLGVGHWWL